MQSLNKAQIIGNLTRTPEIREIESGRKVCTLGVATNRYWTDKNGNKQEEVEFHQVVCWERLAELCEKYLKKGDKVFFEGRLQTRNWEDPSGQKHFRTEIIAEDMIMLTPKSKHENSLPQSVEPDF